MPAMTDEEFKALVNRVVNEYPNNDDDQVQALFDAIEDEPISLLIRLFGKQAKHEVIQVPCRGPGDYRAADPRSNVFNGLLATTTTTAADNHRTTANLWRSVTI